MALSQIALGFARDIQHLGPLDGATHYGVAGVPGDGPYFQLWLIVRDGQILRVSYKTPGCPSSRAVGGGLSQLIQGRVLNAALTLNAKDLRAVIGALPEGKDVNFTLAAEALSNVRPVEMERATDGN